MLLRIIIFIQTLVLLIATKIADMFGLDVKYLNFFLILMLIDVVLGWIKAIKLREWETRRAIYGIISKIVQLVIIGVIYGIDYTFGLMYLTRLFIFYYIIVELASITKNIHDGELAEIPVFLLELSEELKVRIDRIIYNKLKGTIDKIFKD